MKNYIVILRLKLILLKKILILLHIIINGKKHVLLLEK